MTTVSFFTQDGKLTGFLLQGHSTQSAADENGRLVCSAVSSAAYMAANTLTEVLGVQIDAQVEDGYFKLMLTTPPQEAQNILAGLQIHLQNLAQQYPKNINIISEV